MDELGVGQGGPVGRAARWRERVRCRIEVLYPRRHALVSALVLARRAGLPPELRESFTRAGVAHLLAISGFHVGVFAVLVLGTLRAVGVRKRRAVLAGAAVVWGYVLFIGAPDAALRAALLLSLAALGVVRGRPVHRAGALAAGLLFFVLWDPASLGRVGVQLSFAGAAGLALLTPVVEGALRRRVGWERWPALRTAVAAGVGATVATLPAVAWHFDRVSLVGIPTTLVGTPLVAVAIPGVLASLALDALPVIPHPVAAFVAGGADLLLGLLTVAVEAASSPEWVVARIPRNWLVAGGFGTALGAGLLAPARNVGRDVRLLLAVASAGAAVLLVGPAETVAARGTLELFVMDVGQGDAVALRSPRGRWLLVDAGPPAPRGAVDPTPRSLAGLRRRGVDRLEALVLTHPDLDHIGGAPAVITTLKPRVVAGPGQVRGTGAYLNALGVAAGAAPEVRPSSDGRAGPSARPAVRTPWLTLRSGDRLELDGVTLEVLHPDRRPEPSDEPNAGSVVLRLRFGGFVALLTGDAPREVEESLNVGDVDVLKVAHHGSRTSSSSAFLAALRPEVALVSAGRRNRYGHPHPAVLGRLLDVVEELHRTDRHGSIRVIARRDGSWTVHRERAISQGG